MILILILGLEAHVIGADLLRRYRLYWFHSAITSAKTLLWILILLPTASTDNNNKHNLNNDESKIEKFSVIITRILYVYVYNSKNYITLEKDEITEHSIENRIEKLPVTSISLNNLR